MVTGGLGQGTSGSCTGRLPLLYGLEVDISLACYGSACRVDFMPDSGGAVVVMVGHACLAFVPVARWCCTGGAESAFMSPLCAYA